jgi:hypothetical protein
MIQKLKMKYDLKDNVTVVPSVTNLTEIVERDITRLFKIFRSNPAIFLSESDVESYLYSLLINEPEIRDFLPTLTNFSYALESSKTLLVHSNMRVKIKDKNRIVYFSIFQPKETLDWGSEEFWDNMIGLEIKCNRRIPAGNEKCSIIEDVDKVSDFKKGYVLWLNWNIEIDEDNLNKCKQQVERYKNVKLFYLDIFSDPIKTNIPNL